MVEFRSRKTPGKEDDKREDKRAESSWDTLKRSFGKSPAMTICHADSIFGKAPLFWEA